MSHNGLRHIIVGLVLSAVLVLAVRIEFFRNHAAAAVDFSRIPLNFGPWQGKDLTIESYVYEILETKNVLARRYRDARGRDVYLSIVYSGNDRQSFHPPEICYLGSGLELVDRTRETVNLSGGREVTANRLTMRSDKGKITAWYWFLSGNDFVADFYRQQLQFIWGALRGKELPGALVRVSTMGSSADRAQAARSFIADLAPYLSGAFPE